MALKIGVAGGLGRMGSLLIKEILDNPGLATLACIGARDPEKMQKVLARPEVQITDSPKTLIEASDIVIDFTAPELSLRHAYYAAELGKKLVIGTTGFTQEQHKKLKEAATQSALFVTSNTSLGIAVLLKILPLVKEALGDSFDIDIRDIHHKHKKDAPSGTALSLAQRLSPASPPRLHMTQVGKTASSSERSPEEIGISVTRAGGVIGEHDVTFTSENEVVTLSHRSLDRRLFATGAFKAALWLTKQKPGLYEMKDVLESPL